MADDKSKRGSPDSKRPNRGEPYEVAYARSKRAATVKKAAAKKSPARAAKAGAATRRTAPVPRPAKRAAPHPPTAEKTVRNTAPRTMKVADAVDLLTDDHVQVAARFKQYEKLAKAKAPAGQREALASTICQMLKAHTTIEEEIFYPAARRAGVEKNLLDEADIEHASAKELIAQIEMSSPADDHYDAKVKVLGDYVEHHVIEEHTEMFTKCRRAGMDLVALRARMAQRKAELAPGGAEPPAVSASMQAESPGLLSRIGESLFSR
ncbi:MAG: hemerythrin domain-containing protein [Caldimonas sp.]